MKRASAVVRAWDGPNSRIAFEMDLDQMPWGPFEALGKQVTLLVPEREGGEDAGREDGGPQLERALRHVEHAAERCAEFAELGNGSDQLWRSSLETWEWLRDFLTEAWMERQDDGSRASTPGSSQDGDGGEARAASRSAAPDMPGAAATLEVAASALRQTPLAVWREAIGTFNPDAPTREEAIQTLLGVARLLGRAREAAEAASRVGAPAEPGAPESPAAPGRADATSPASSPEVGSAARQADDGGTESGSDAAEPGTDDHAAGGNAPDDEELSFDYAAGYDEGYRMGRKVGRALAARERKKRDR